MRLDRWDGLELTADDVHRKFQQTYIYATHPEINDNNPTVLYIEQVDGNALNLQYRPTGGGRSRSFSCRTNTLDVRDVYPSIVGAVPDGKSVVIFRRLPARQWQVGLCRANAQILSRELQPLAVNLSTASGLFNPVYEDRPIAEILRRFEIDHALMAFALSSVYWLARRKDKIVLYRNATALGSFVFGTFFVNKSCTDLSQELWDDLRIKVNGSGN